MEIVASVVAVVLVALGGVVLAKHRRKRNMGRYIRGGIDEALSLGTLAAKDAISQIIGDAPADRLLISSIVCTYSLTAFTKSTGDGPILVGIAHSDYTAAEIEEWIESSGSWDEGNKQQQEVANRLVRRIGIFDNPIDEAAAARLNDGRMIKTKLNWIVQEDQRLSLWAYNIGTSALATTSPAANMQGHANRWAR